MSTFGALVSDKPGALGVDMNTSEAGSRNVFFRCHENKGKGGADDAEGVDGSQARSGRQVACESPSASFLTARLLLVFLYSTSLACQYCLCFESGMYVQ